MSNISETEDNSSVAPDFARRSMFKLSSAAAIGVGVAALTVNRPANAATYSAYFNVKDYGAVGDGVANDTATVNAAITAAPASSTVYFPKGVYRIASALIINKSLKLTGDFGSTLSFYQGTPGISIAPPVGTALNNVEVSNLSLTGTTRVAGTSGIQAIATSLANGIGYLTIDNVNIALFDFGIKAQFCQFASLRMVHTYFNNTGIYTKRCVNTKMAASVSESNLTWGLVIDGDSNAIEQSCGSLISACQIVGNGTNQTASGNISIAYNENFEINGCMIDVPMPGSQYNVLVAHTTRASIAQCWIGASGGSGVQFTFVTETILTSNTILSSAGYGIAMESTWNCIVNSNVLRSNGNTDILIYGAGSKNNAINANICLSQLPSSLPSIQEIGPFNTVCTSNIVKCGVLVDPTSVDANNVLAL